MKEVVLSASEKQLHMKCNHSIQLRHSHHVISKASRSVGVVDDKISISQLRFPLPQSAMLYDLQRSIEHKNLSASDLIWRCASSQVNKLHVKLS